MYARTHARVYNIKYVNLEKFFPLLEHILLEKNYMF